MDEDNFFIGMFITRDGYRGKGIGSKVLQYCLHYAGEGKNIGLQATFNAMILYKRMGFNHLSFSVDEYRFLLERIKLPPFENFCPSNINIREMIDDDINRGMVYDMEVCSIPRPQIFQMWMATSLKKFIAIKDEKAVGFMFAKKGVNGFRVSPFYARDYSIAHSLMHRFVSILKDNEIVEISIPVDNQNSLNLFVDIGLNQKCLIGRSVRMYTQGEIPVNLQQCYGYVNYEPAIL